MEDLLKKLCMFLQQPGKLDCIKFSWPREACTDDFHRKIKYEFNCYVLKCLFTRIVREFRCIHFQGSCHIFLLSFVSANHGVVVVPIQRLGLNQNQDLALEHHPQPWNSITATAGQTVPATIIAVLVTTVIITIIIVIEDLLQEDKTGRINHIQGKYYIYVFGYMNLTTLERNYLNIITAFN
jgi:hypothetical protein